VRFFGALILALTLGACGPGGTSVDDGGTSGACSDDVPLQTWETFGKGFLTAHCQGCHASTAEERYEAPEDVVLDTQADAQDWADRILARASGDDADMPPAGGPSADDKERLRVWLTCYPDR
jgi:uncharacterized membrane protein